MKRKKLFAAVMTVMLACSVLAVSAEEAVILPEETSTEAASEGESDSLENDDIFFEIETVEPIPDIEQTTESETTESETTESETTESETIDSEQQTDIQEDPEQSETSSDIPETGMQTETQPEILEEEEQTETQQADEVQIEDITETVLETEKSKKKKKETEEETELTNEQLIAKQNIIVPEEVQLEFRFVQTDKKYAVVRVSDGIQIYEKKDCLSDAAGEVKHYGLCYILADDEDGWLYVESGKVRGFAKAEHFITGQRADRIVRVIGEEKLSRAEALLQPFENDAFTYTYTTVENPIVPKVYALVKETVEIKEEPTAEARTTGILEKDGLCYILADRNEQWIFVESGDTRGFVQAEELVIGIEVLRNIREKGEDSFALAETLIRPEKNKACYYTLTSIKEASKEAVLRSMVVNYSFRFLGNPYVWGGTSLINGCDCSGFTQSLYAQFGIYIPRTAETQAVNGMQIPVSSAVPGDLIFYAKKGEVYHVSMYIGKGRVIHAMSTQTGIVTSGIGNDAVWAVRVIQ